MLNFSLFVGNLIDQPPYNHIIKFNINLTSKFENISDTFIIQTILLIIISFFFDFASHLITGYFE